MPVSNITAGIIADDLTGALEMGAVCAARGLRTAVSMDTGGADGVLDAVVIDTETRNAKPETAAALVAAASRELNRLGASAVFKKIDSTLRGPIAAELNAIHKVWPGRLIVFTPAYPRLGRTVCCGRLFTDGVEVSRSAFAHDPRSPVLDSEIASVLPPGSDEWLRSCDALTDDDLRRIVANGLDDKVYVGSGGLGRVWAEELVRVGRDTFASPSRRPERVLVISGSHHPASIQQCAYASNAGHRVVSVPEVLGDSDEVQRTLVANALEQIAAHHPDLIVLFGGETAARVLRAAGTSALYPIRELIPGIALSQARVSGAERLVVTKAGGFGSADVVDTILVGVNE